MVMQYNMLRTLKKSLIDDLKLKLTSIRYVRMYTSIPITKSFPWKQAMVTWCFHSNTVLLPQ